MTAHTPGPWSVYEGRVHDNVFRKNRTVCAGKDGRRHAVAYCDYMTPELAEANAHLIAAAPCMLAALRAARVVVEAEGARATLVIVDAAIARAEGRQTEGVE